MFWFTTVLILDLTKLCEPNLQMTWHPKSSLTVEHLQLTFSNLDYKSLLSSSTVWDLDFQMKWKKTLYIWKNLEVWTPDLPSSSAQVRRDWCLRYLTQGMWHKIRCYVNAQWHWFQAQSTPCEVPKMNRHTYNVEVVFSNEDSQTNSSVFLKAG